MNTPEISLVPALDENNLEDRERLKRELKPIIDLAAKPNLNRLGSIAKSAVTSVTGLGWLVREKPSPGWEVLIGAGVAGAPWMEVLATVGPALGTALGAWLQSKSGRKVKVKHGPNGQFEVEATNIEELKKALEVIKNQSSKVILEP
jgi:hypothetical protein